jgi:hypothetical protein
MTHFPKSLLVRVFSALVFCTLIAAGGAYAKDIEDDANRGSTATEPASGTLKTRQIAVEPASAEQTPPNAKTAETDEPAPAPKAPAAPLEKPSAAGEDDDAAPAPEEEQRSQPTSPEIEHGNDYAYAYVLRYRAAHGHGYHHYRPAYGYDGDDYESAGYSHDRGYEHCD